MKDIQSLSDDSRVDIKKVGVKTISYPITLLDKKNRKQHTIASVNMYVNLPHRFKGTHMSRFIEILNMFHGEIDLKNFHTILEEMKKRLDAESSHIEIHFPYFLSMDDENSLYSCRYDCSMYGSMSSTDNLELKISVPVTRSLLRGDGQKETFSTGQWGIAHIAVRFRKFIWIEDLIYLIEGAMHENRAECVAGDESTVEQFCARIDNVLRTCDELKWYSVTVESLNDGYSTFAFIESEHTPDNL